MSLLTAWIHEQFWLEANLKIFLSLMSEVIASEKLLARG